MISLSEDNVTQGLHAALGALFVMVPVAMAWHHPKAIGTGVGIIFAAIKEFWFDIHFETPETSGGWSGGVRDFSFYIIGIIAANAVLFI